MAWLPLRRYLILPQRSREQCKPTFLLEGQKRARLEDTPRKRAGSLNGPEHDDKTWVTLTKRQSSSAQYEWAMEEGGVDGSRGRGDSQVSSPVVSKMIPVLTFLCSKPSTISTINQFILCFPRSLSCEGLRGLVSAGKKIRVLPEAPSPKEKDLTVCIMKGQCTAQVDGEGCEPAGAADIERQGAGGEGWGGQESNGLESLEHTWAEQMLGR